MEKALKAVRELRDRGVILDFAIGGGIAVLYYVEPFLTYDLDIFFIPVEERFDTLSPIYDYLKKKGYRTQREHVIIDGVPVQFIPAYNELVKEAVQNSTGVKYGRVNTKVLSVEYLVAIMLQTYRTKDRERILKIFEEVQVDLKFLKKLLRKFNLYERYTKFRERYFGSE